MTLGVLDYCEIQVLDKMIATNRNIESLSNRVIESLLGRYPECFNGNVGPMTQWLKDSMRQFFLISRVSVMPSE